MVVFPLLQTRIRFEITNCFYYFQELQLVMRHADFFANVRNMQSDLLDCNSKAVDVVMDL